MCEKTQFLKIKVSQTTYNLVKQKNNLFVLQIFFFKYLHNYLGNTLILEKKAIFHLKMYTRPPANTFSVVAKKLLNCKGKFFELRT